MSTIGRTDLLTQSVWTSEVSIVGSFSTEIASDFTDGVGERAIRPIAGESYLHARPYGASPMNIASVCERIERERERERKRRMAIRQRLWTRRSVLYPCQHLLEERCRSTEKNALVTRQNFLTILLDPNQIIVDGWWQTVSQSTSNSKASLFCAEWLYGQEKNALTRRANQWNPGRFFLLKTTHFFPFLHFLQNQSMDKRRCFVFSLAFFVITFVSCLTFTNQYAFFLESLPKPLIDIFTAVDSPTPTNSSINKTENATSNNTAQPFRSRVSDYYPRMPIHIYTQDIPPQSSPTKLILLGNGFFGTRNWDGSLEGNTSTKISKMLHFDIASTEGCLLFQWLLSRVRFSRITVMSPRTWVVSPRPMPLSIIFVIVSTKRKQKQNVDLVNVSSSLSGSRHHTLLTWNPFVDSSTGRWLIVSNLMFSLRIILAMPLFIRPARTFVWCYTKMPLAIWVSKWNRMNIDLRIRRWRRKSLALPLLWYRIAVAPVTALASSMSWSDTSTCKSMDDVEQRVRRKSTVENTWQRISTISSLSRTASARSMSVSEPTVSSIGQFNGFSLLLAEKFFATLEYPVVPVVLGRMNYSLLIPPSGFINVRDFVNVRALAQHLNETRYNQEKYLSYFSWKKDYVWGLNHFFNPFCDLCLRLHLDTTPKVIDDIHSWWFDQACESANVPR